MTSVFENYGSYNPQSTMYWSGLTSNKFGRTRRHLQPENSIKANLTFQEAYTNRGRKFLQQESSPETKFRSSIRIVKKQHWTQRTSSKKIVDHKLTEPFPRREKRHLSPLSASTNLGVDQAGLRTFYNLGLKNEGRTEYSVEDKMQRKGKVSQLELRRTFFQNESTGMRFGSTMKSALTARD